MKTFFSITLFLLFAFCTSNLATREQYISNRSTEDEFKIDNLCMDKLKAIAVDSLKTDNLKSGKLILRNGRKGIVFKNKYGSNNKPTVKNGDIIGVPKKDYRWIFIGINDDCGIDTIMLFNDSSEIISECNF